MTEEQGGKGTEGIGTLGGEEADGAVGSGLRGGGLRDGGRGAVGVGCAAEAAVHLGVTTEVIDEAAGDIVALWDDAHVRGRVRAYLII